MKQNCRNCHFFAKEFREENSDRSLSFSVDIGERKSAEHDDFSFRKDIYSLKCHMGVWDEGVGPNENRKERINKVDRKDKCFFYPYDPNMLFQAAIELQKRKQEYQQFHRSNMYTRIGLWIAALALLANAIIGIIQLSCNNGF